MDRADWGKEGSLKEQCGRGEEEEEPNKEQDTCYKERGCFMN